MPRTKVFVPDVAEVAPGLWSNAIRAGDMIYRGGPGPLAATGSGSILGRWLSVPPI